MIKKDLIIDLSKKTDYLLCGDNPVSNYNKALNADVKIIDENKFKELFNE